MREAVLLPVLRLNVSRSIREGLSNKALTPVYTGGMLPRAWSPYTSPRCISATTTALGLYRSQQSISRRLSDGESTLRLASITKSPDSAQSSSNSSTLSTPLVESPRGIESLDSLPSLRDQYGLAASTPETTASHSQSMLSSRRMRLSSSEPSILTNTLSIPRANTLPLSSAHYFGSVKPNENPAGIVNRINSYRSSTILIDLYT